VLALAACGSSLPAPPKGTSPSSAFIDVPSPPPPAKLELVPDHPHERAVWIDGAWEWTGTRWRWKDGGWFAAPAPGVVYSRWETRRPGGARLVFADATWRDPSGAEVQGPRLLASATISSITEDDAGLGDAGSALDAGSNDGGAP
jgi:hypothetical protein